MNDWAEPSDATMFEITCILNDPVTCWKVKRALLRHKIGLNQSQIEELVPKEET